MEIEVETEVKDSVKGSNTEGNLEQNKSSKRQNKKQSKKEKQGSSEKKELDIPSVEQLNLIVIKRPLKCVTNVQC
jgi:hypothetical protein